MSGDLHKMRDGVAVPLSDDEVAQREADDRQWRAEKAAREANPPLTLIQRIERLEAAILKGGK